MMETKRGNSAQGEWECMECGYIEVGVETQPPQACPDCHAPLEALEFFPYEDDLCEGDLYGDEQEDEPPEALYEDDGPVDEE